MKKTRTICFYDLVLTKNENNLSVIDAFNLVVKYINSLSKTEKKVELSTTKFCVLDEVKTYQNSSSHHLIFKSAMHGYRPPLINSKTIEERENPKKIEESDRDKTHIVVTKDGDDVIVLIEKYTASLTFKQFVQYLNKFVNQPIFLEMNKLKDTMYFNCRPLVIKDYLAVIDKIPRVKSIEIEGSKQILGSAALNYSNRLSNVKDNIIIKMTAKRKLNIKEIVKDILNNTNGRAIVGKMVITADNEENHEIKIDTDRLERKEYIDVDYYEETGEIKSLSIFNEMESILI